MLLLQLGSFLLELSTSQGAQAQGLVFCQELQLRNNTTGKSLKHEKKNPANKTLLPLEQQQPQHRGLMEAVGDAGLEKAGTELGGAGAVSPARLALPWQ